jgi:hypothetical protein
MLNCSDHKYSYELYCGACPGKIYKKNLFLFFKSFFCFFKTWYLHFYGMKLKLFYLFNLHTPIHNPTRLLREVNSIIFDRFFAVDHDSVLEFFPARQDLEIIGLLSVKNAIYKSSDLQS